MSNYYDGIKEKYQNRRGKKRAGSSTGGRPPVNPPPIPLTVRPFGIPLSTDFQRLMRLDRARQLKQADHSERWALENETEDQQHAHVTDLKVLHTYSERSQYFFECT